MNICNLDIGHFKHLNLIEKTPLRSLKNLPTTWGLRLIYQHGLYYNRFISEKPPHHMGIKTLFFGQLQAVNHSEKPPHHMGIKTWQRILGYRWSVSLKNLPTTWGLRPYLRFDNL